MTMVRLTSIICVILLSWWQTQEATGHPLIVIAKAIEIGIQIYNAAEKYRKFIEEETEFDPNSGEVAVLIHLQRIDDHIAELHSQISSLIYNENLRLVSGKMQQIFKVVEYVNRTYAKFQLLNETESCITNNNLDFLFEKNVLNFGINGLEDNIIDMHNNFIQPDPGTGDSLLTLIRSDENPELMCNRRQSTQQTLTDIFNSIVNTELQALAMRLVAWEKLTKKNSLFEESELEAFKIRMHRLHDAATDLIHTASRNVWRCDPRKHVKDVSYSKLEQVFQAFVTNEQDTEEDTCSKGNCWELYEWDPQEKIEYTRHSYKPNSDYAKSQNHKLRCDGHITDCKVTAERIDYCLASDEDRRYTGLRYSDGKVLGEPYEDGDCDTRDKAKQYWSGLNRCKFCLCTCASKKRFIDRYFSLEEVNTNYINKWVVTGVQLKKANHVFYIEIQKGLIRKDGTIEEDSVRWVEQPPKKYNFDQIAQSNSHRSNKSGDFPVNEDVYSVNWEQKTVYVDVAENEASEFDLVVTGLRFKQQGGALKLQARLNPFEADTGKILEGTWYPPDNEKKIRKRIQLTNAHDPIKLWEADKKLRNLIDLVPGKFLKFAVTNLDKDVGQSTIPFIDIQKVYSNPPMPLAGVGLYHKGLGKPAKSGGFLGLQIIQYDAYKNLR